MGSGLSAEQLSAQGVEPLPVGAAQTAFALQGQNVGADFINGACHREGGQVATGPGVALRVKE